MNSEVFPPSEGRSGRPSDVETAVGRDPSRGVPAGHAAPRRKFPTPSRRPWPRPSWPTPRRRSSRTSSPVQQAERDDYLDALRRLQADFENFKKRTLKLQTEHLERAAQALVDKLLPVLDAADLAIAHGAGEVVVQVAGLLMDTLVKEGLEGVDPKPGDPFDPTVHEAVAHEPGDGGTQEVADLLRAGYLWKGALLRPAMVKVRG